MKTNPLKLFIKKRELAPQTLDVIIGIPAETNSCITNPQGSFVLGKIKQCDELISLIKSSWLKNGL